MRRDAVVDCWHGRLQATLQRGGCLTSREAGAQWAQSPRSSSGKWIASEREKCSDADGSF
jgi:hypothetical protein